MYAHLPERRTVFDKLGSANAEDFAIIYRPSADGPRSVDIVIGETSTFAELSELPLAPRPHSMSDQPRHDILALIPYRQIAERGFDAIDDGTPLTAMRISEQYSLTLSDVLSALPEDEPDLKKGGFDIQDAAYGEIVDKIIREEIGQGAGSNFVVKRSFIATVRNYSLSTALGIFRRLLAREMGSYWTFLIKIGGRTLIGATPERHISVSRGLATMTPISGTYRYAANGPSIAGLLNFLADAKEADELYMVLDEELKMMARISERGGRVAGPYIKEMAHLAHTEYVIEGRTLLDFRQILRETMFAPPVVGSPLENACRVVTRYERSGRGYYSGVLALIGRDPAGLAAMDSAIAIRTADITDCGELRIDVGATLVRHSDPAAEAAETLAKAAGLLTAIGGHSGSPATTAKAGAGRDVEGLGRLAKDPSVQAALLRRNTGLSRFWLDTDLSDDFQIAELRGQRALVIDAEDTFTAMLGHQLRALGLHVTLLAYQDVPPHADSDLVIMGPGPGDPTNLADAKMRVLREIGGDLLGRRMPLLGLCLGHQIIADLVGLMVRRRATPNQGVQREVTISGSRQRVGFYNTFCAFSDQDETHCPGIGKVKITRDDDTDEVHALRGPHFSSFQFHPESVLTENGISILGREVADLLFPDCRRGVGKLSAGAL